MKKNTKQTLFFLTLAFVAGMWVMYWLNPKIIAATTPAIEKETKVQTPTSLPSSTHSKVENNPDQTLFPTPTSKSIDQLTQEEVVVAYLKANQKLPDYYLTKKEAKKQGWVPSKGNLCDVLPGHAIGGDYFSNREKKLPIKKGRKYFEADINYNCGRRGADRLVYSNDGLIYSTKDHYSTFQKR